MDFTYYYFVDWDFKIVLQFKVVCFRIYILRFVTWQWFIINIRRYKKRIIYYK